MVVEFSGSLTLTHQSYKDMEKKSGRTSHCLQVSFVVIILLVLFCSFVMFRVKLLLHSSIHSMLYNFVYTNCMQAHKLVSIVS